MSNKNKPLLQVRNLKQHFELSGKRTLRAVDGVSFDISEGETLGLVGESGCGKSTTIRTIARLYKPTAGEVIFEGKDLANLNKKELIASRREMQSVFQDPYESLSPRITVGNIIAEPLTIFRNRKLIDIDKTGIDRKVAQVMERVGLRYNLRKRYPHEFSGGQRQRIGIARALIMDPKLILLDEPVSALDVSIQAQVLNLLSDLQEERGLSYLFVAHDLAVVRYTCHRVAVMYLGQIMEMCEASRLYENPMHPYTESLLSAVPVPDPEIERSRTRILLEGDLPSPTVKIFGCPFYSRCPKKMDRCLDNKPKLVEVESGHKVACFLHEK